MVLLRICTSLMTTVCILNFRPKICSIKRSFENYDRTICSIIISNGTLSSTRYSMPACIHIERPMSEAQIGLRGERWFFFYVAGNPATSWFRYGATSFTFKVPKKRIFRHFFWLVEKNFRYLKFYFVHLSISFENLVTLKLNSDSLNVNFHTVWIFPFS